METCNYFRRLSDGTTWAIAVRDGRPARAAGPLDPDLIGAAPVALSILTTVDAAGWDLAAFAPPAEADWENAHDLGTTAAPGEATEGESLWRRRTLDGASADAGDAARRLAELRPAHA